MARARARHILLDTEEKCNDLLKQLNDGADFAQLAKTHSTCPSGRQSGGELGEFSPGQMVREFDEVVFGKAEVGVVQGPVKTQFGCHIVEVTSRK